MKRMTKIAAGVIALLLIAGGAGLFFSQSRIASLVKAVAGVEESAEDLLTEAVGTEVDIESIETSLADGEMRIHGLAVSNPAGFRTEHAFEAREIRVVLDIASLLSDPVVIREISIGRPIVTYEIGPDGTNLDAIQRNVESFAESERSTDSGDPGTRIVIEHLYVRDGTVAASAVFLDGKALWVPLPDIHLQDLSTGEGGTTADDLVEAITTEIVKNARESVAPLAGLTDDIKDRIAGEASRLAERLKQGLETGSESTREALEKGAESAERELEKQVETAREALERGTESAKEALGKGAESTRKAIEGGTESAREAIEKETDRVKQRLKKLLRTGDRGD